MRKLFYMFIGLGLLASCSNNPDDGLPEPQYDAADSQYGDGKYEEGVNRYESAALLRGSYNLSWVVDREEVDTASLSKGDGPHDAFISHFPMAYFLNLIGKKVESTEISYTWSQSAWKLNYSVIGYSANNAYLQNSVWAPLVWFQVNGEDYSFQIYMNMEESATNKFTSLMHDLLKDMWSGATPVYRFVLKNHKTNESWDKTFSTPINMTFQTTGRKK